MCNILVTGGAGFIGSNLVDRLIQDGHKVKIWDFMLTGKKENINPEAKFYEIDVSAISPEFHTAEKYDVIYHLAALARIQPSFEKPGMTFEMNVKGTSKILELARLHGSRVVYAGSSSFYHDVYANPYTFTKWQGEELCKLYNKVYNVPVSIARFFNVYGPRHLSEGAYATVMAIFERQKQEGLPLTVTGDGKQRRDFTHVRDIVDGLVKLGEHDWAADVFNFGSGRNWGILELAYLFDPVSIEYLPQRPGEATSTLADTTDTFRKLGWRASHSGIREYVKTFLESL